MSPRQDASNKRGMKSRVYISTEANITLCVGPAGNPSVTGWLATYPVNTKHLYNICTTSAQRRRRWADVVQMLLQMFCVCRDIPD